MTALSEAQGLLEHYLLDQAPWPVQDDNRREVRKLARLLAEAGAEAAADRAIMKLGAWIHESNARLSALEARIANASVERGRLGERIDEEGSARADAVAALRWEIESRLRELEAR